jgi:3-hydroxyacyl-[acyl-carrier-protein] dehydratase
MTISTLELAEILAPLAHRYPRIMIDRVLEHVPGRQARALKNVTVNEPFFQGHFPSFPVMPGILVIEALIQLSAVLAHDIGHGLDVSDIDGVRFKRQVAPGDQLLLESVLESHGDGVGRFSVRASVLDEVAAEARLVSRLPVAATGRG